ncbi:ATP-binding protein [Dactylosporangium sp. CA-092794]|uniref:ATP-binding protein n=1 Tax=Dactylosporangium sp. CA-092794 TaxID=3239929 RepID=UPI003D8E8FC5
MISDSSIPADDLSLHATASGRGTVNQFVGNQYNQYLSAPAATPVQVIRTLRPNIATFIGRTKQIHEITETTSTSLRAGQLIPMFAVDGMPGVGKTALVVYVGHLLADQFPDGQLFVDLHGHTVDRTPVDPFDALATLLAATGLPAEQIPATLEEREAKWRDRMASKRVLLILDNAATADQVAPLLLGSSGCLTLITGRRRMPVLRRNYGANLMSLGVLPETDAVSLFARVCPRPLSVEDKRAVLDITALCGLLPLAITIVAANIDAEVDASVARQVADLRVTRDRLASIDAHLDEREIGVAAAFDMSYQRLAIDQRRTFRLLSLSPGTDVDFYAVAALTGLSLGTVRRHMHVLYTHRLINQPSHQRFRLHDLIAEYARSRVDPDEQDLALNSLLDYYQHAAAIAGEQLSARGARPSHATNQMPVTSIPNLEDLLHATEWLRVERANLQGCLQYARDRRLLHRVVDLAASLAYLARRSGPWTEGIDLHTLALGIQRQMGDRHGEAGTLAELGSLRRLTGDYPEATALLEQALTAFDEVGDRHGQAWALRELGALSRGTGDYLRATELQRQALTIFEETGDRHDQAWTLRELGGLSRGIGDYPRATELQRQALTIFEEVSDRNGQAWTFRELGALRRLVGDYFNAAQLQQQAFTIFEDSTDRHGQAYTSFEQGLLRRLTGDYRSASEMQRRVLTIFEETNDLHGQAYTLAELGVLARLTGDYARADALLRQALTMLEDTNDRVGQAYGLAELGTLCRVAGDYTRAVELLERAKLTFDDIGDRPGRARILCELGVLSRLTGNLQRAVEMIEEAVTIRQEIGDRHGESATLNQLGISLIQFRDLDGAMERFNRSLLLAREVGSPLQEAHALTGLGRCAKGKGTIGATEASRKARQIFERIGIGSVEALNSSLTYERSDG